MVKWEDVFKHYSIICLNELLQVKRQILTEVQIGDLLSTRLELAATNSGLLGFKPCLVRWSFFWLSIQEPPGLSFMRKWYTSLHFCSMQAIAGHANCEDYTTSVKQLVIYYWRWVGGFCWCSNRQGATAILDSNKCCHRAAYHFWTKMQLQNWHLNIRPNTNKTLNKWSVWPQRSNYLFAQN